MRDGQSIPWLGHAAAAVHARLWSRLRSRRAQGDGDGTARSGPAQRRVGPRVRGAGARSGICTGALRQRAGDRLRRAPEAAPLRRFPSGAGALAAVTRRLACRPRRQARRHGGSRRRRGGAVTDAVAYNFAYLDEQSKRTIRRAILKAVAIPGYQVPFPSREMPMPYGWGTGGVQLTASILGPHDVLKVIDQGADDTTNAVSIRQFFARTAGVRTTTRTSEARIIQTRHRIPEAPLAEGQIIVYQVPIPEPLRFLEPRESETRQMHALEDYGLMHVKLYEDIARHGHIATAYAYPVMVEARYLMDPSPTPK